jgi:hypothetical protein
VSFHDRLHIFLKRAGFLLKEVMVGNHFSAGFFFVTAYFSDPSMLVTDAG